MDLEGVVGRFAGTLLAVLTREDNFPLYDVIIYDYKQDLKNYPGETPRDVINDCILKLCRALVHSTDIVNIKEGIQMLEDGHRGVLGVLSPLQKREMFYLLAVGYYADRDYSKSSYLLLHHDEGIYPPSAMSNGTALKCCPALFCDVLRGLTPAKLHCTTLQPSIDPEEKFGSVLWFLIGGEHQYYRDMILDCERDIAEAGDDAPDEVKNENIIKLSWALVHTRQPEDVQRGIAMLEASIEKGGLSQLQIRDMLYIRSLGHYISRDFIKSLNGLCQCLEVAPDFWQGRYLRRTVSTRMDRDEILGALILYNAVTFVPAIIKARSHPKT